MARDNLKYSIASLFIDGTFSIAPTPFQQTLVVMDHDPTYNVYLQIPCWRLKLNVLTVTASTERARSHYHLRIDTNFWHYFTRTWMKTFPSALWNVNLFMATYVDMHNRTNNPIESYNRRVKQAIGVHPTLPEMSTN
ncbi:Hypothetical protein PHPALM_144 [Phytophthora palmivora]|uniref:MULE transposase domain-containing protein n=1 Tax=Phytophthora palmivora TaxID=4796 RepID=A0A2P4YVK7_9STRA|nr:Hypothetical protein PHPALM_144 [Phytophthora palmivora]